MEPELITQEFLNGQCFDKWLKEDGNDANKYFCNANDWNLPTAPFIVSDQIQDWKQVQHFIEQNINSFPFIKTCDLSPKDWKNPPCFDTVESAMEALQNSTRTKYFLNKKCRHVIMKQKRNYTSQSRCFWNGDRLRVSIGNMSKNLVLKFFEIYQYSIPFHYCCIELGEFENGKVELIEINSFGLTCGPDPLDWSQNWHELLFTKEPIFIVL